MSEDRFASPRPRKPPSRPPKRNISTDLTVRVLRGLIDRLEGIVARLENQSSPANSPNPQQKKRSPGYQLSKILSPIRRIVSFLAMGKAGTLGAIAIGAILIAILSQVIQKIPGEKPPAEIPQTNPSEPKKVEIVINETQKTPEEIPAEAPPSEPTTEPTTEPTADRVEPVAPEMEPEILTETPSTSEDLEIAPEAEAETPPAAENLSENPDQIPLFLVATAPSEPVNFISPPSLKFTSEQYLIATIRAKMRRATAKISPELVISVEAKFSASLLRVELGGSWYELADGKQTQIANILFQQAQNFDFTRLELVDSGGKTLARSAVIGSNIIILNRTKSPT